MKLKILKNTIAAAETITAIGVLAGLAVKFQKWWIILFALAFIVIIAGVNKESNDDKKD